MAWSGKFTPVNPDKYKGDHTNIIYRSLWEKHVFKWADTSSGVKHWSSEETVISYVYEVDKKFHRYFVDLKLILEDGKTLLVEIKPFKETQTPVNPGRRTPRFLSESLTYVKNQNKWKAATKYAEARGWEFQVWTEKELTKMGILPKMSQVKPLGKEKGLQKLKPLKPFKKSKK